MPARVLQPVVGNDPVRSADAFRRIAGFIDDPIAHCSHVAGTEAANVIRVTLQVRDRLDVVWPGRWLVWVFITATENGDPVATQTVTFNSGSVLETVLIDGVWRVVTTTAGLIELDITIVGAATRYVHTIVEKRADSAAVVWS